MDRHLKTLRIAAVLVLLVMLFSSCGSQPAPEGSAERLRELGETIVDDLQRKILPNRETPEKLVEYGFVVSHDGVSDGIDALAEFFVSYEGGNDGEVTVVFAGDSFVVSRVAFIQGAGYYLRYEYDKFRPDELAVNGQLIDDVDLKYSTSPPKWDMTLKLNNKQVARFLFNNPVKRQAG